MVPRDSQPMTASPPFPPGVRCVMCEQQPSVRHGVDQKMVDENGRSAVFFGEKGEMYSIALYCTLLGEGDSVQRCCEGNPLGFRNVPRQFRVLSVD